MVSAAVAKLMADSVPAGSASRKKPQRKMETLLHADEIMIFVTTNTSHPVYPIHVEKYFRLEFPDLCRDSNCSLSPSDFEGVKGEWRDGYFAVRFRTSDVADEVFRVYEQNYSYMYSTRIGLHKAERKFNRDWRSDGMISLLKMEVGEWYNDVFQSRSPYDIIHAVKQKRKEAFLQPMLVLKRDSLEVIGREVSVEQGITLCIETHNIVSVAHKGEHLIVQCRHPPPLKYHDRLENTYKYRFDYTSFHFHLDGDYDVLQKWILLFLPHSIESMPLLRGFREENYFETFPQYHALHFNTQYMLVASVQHRIVHRDDVTPDFLVQLGKLTDRHQYIFLDTLWEKVKEVGYIHPQKELTDNWKTGTNNEITSDQSSPSVDEIDGESTENQKSSADNKMTLMKHIYVTPSRILFSRPIFETSSRFTRKYKHLQQYFTRVHFVEDDLESNIGTNDFVRIMKKLLQKGIPLDIPLREYLDKECALSSIKSFHFLAFGSSQLKEQSCFMMLREHRDGNPTPEEIRRGLGNFHRLKYVASYAARIGQCFSDTRPTVSLKRHEIDTIDDVERNSYIFSDGVGRMSRELAQPVSKHFKLKYIPSAIQIRLGGCKGMLTLSPEELMKGKKVLTRPSQQKFQSDHLQLECCGVSRFREAFLNREFIQLFSLRGIPYDVFRNFMKDHILELDEMFFCKKKALMIAYHSNMETAALGSGIPLQDMIENYCLHDKCVQALLFACKKRQIQDLERKARIPVPPSSSTGLFSSALLYGVVDDTFSLEANQVYVQIDPQEQAKNSPFNTHSPSLILEGSVVVSKNPATHPGDLMVLDSVDCEKLHHLKNVVVFSAKGPRPVPDQIAGSDCDGDEFAVFWHPDLIPKTQNPKPFSYQAPKKLPPKSTITKDDLIDFFCQSVTDNKLGQLCHLHLAFSEAKGLASEECLHYVKEIQLALDYPKTGVPPDRALEYKLRREQYPIFLDGGKTIYDTPLCKLYIHAQKERKRAGVSGRKTLKDMDFIWYEENFHFPGRERYKEEAKSLLREYVGWCDALFLQLGCFTEDEADIVFYQVSTLPKKMRSRIPCIVDKMIQTMRQKVKGICKKESDRKAFMSALLLTCYDERTNPKVPSQRVEFNRDTVEEVQRGILLPWLIDGRCLLEIVAKRTDGKSTLKLS